VTRTLNIIYNFAPWAFESHAGTVPVPKVYREREITMSYLTSKSNRCSGEVLPLILREKLQQKRSGASDDSSSANIGSCGPEIARGLSVEDRNRKFTADELEDELWKTSQALVEVQRQIGRGEEVYYEETQAYGSNLFRGWETFIDSRDVGTSNNTANVQGGGPRRVPNDFRWFSSSATSLGSRHLKPEPMGSRMSSTVTSASASDASAAPASTKSAVPSAPGSTKSDTSDVTSKNASITEPPAPPTTKQEPGPKVVAEPSANVDDSENAEATESSKGANQDEAMDEGNDKEPEPTLSTAITTDESKQEKRKAPSESADSPKEGKDSAPRRTKRKRRSGVNN
jgi:hypothetical protein